MKETIVVLGGGAGGLELVVTLARKLRRDKNADVVLIDKNPSHIWKPLFHEVATGSMDSHHDEASYRMLARKHRFQFVLGTAEAVNIDEQLIKLGSVADEEGREMTPARSLSYTTLVLAVGSLSNDFGIDGVRAYSKQLDSREQAERFHTHFATQLHRVNSSDDPEAKLNVVIVGGGATGVELAADMHNVVHRLSEFGFDNFPKERLLVSVIEAAPELLPRLPDRIGQSVRRELTNIGVNVRPGTMVSSVEADAVITSEEERIQADISVWAAGVKAPQWLAQSGFPVDRLGRILVDNTLAVAGFDNLYSIGDCCRCLMEDGTEVPPRAQAAHQMASSAARNILARRKGNIAKAFTYRDFGSLVSLSSYSTIGNLMGNLVRGTVFIEGWMARLVYLSLYRMHQASVHGKFSTLLIMLGDRIHKATRASVKLH